LKALMALDDTWAAPGQLMAQANKLIEQVS
jgi:hypothetical protein